MSSAYDLMLEMQEEGYEDITLFLMETPHGKRYWRVGTDDCDAARSEDRQESIPADLMSIESVADAWIAGESVEVCLNHASI